MALLSFTAGSLITARLVHIDHVRADSNRVFELRIYHTVPGKLPALESRFRDIYSKLLAKHDLQVGYWVPEGGSRLGQHIRLPRGSFQPGGSKKELGRNAGGPRGSGGNQIRAGQQAGGKDRPNVHAVDGFFADEVVSQPAEKSKKRQVHHQPELLNGSSPQSVAVHNLKLRSERKMTYEQK